MTDAGSEHEADLVESLVVAARFWWFFILLGGAWLVFAVTVFRFDWRSVSAVSLVFGVVMLVAAADELLAAFSHGESGWRRAGRLLLVVAFVVIAVVAFAHPGNTFRALAAILSYYFIFAGGFRVAEAIGARHETAWWGILLLLGIVEILIGFWAAGDFGRRNILLVVWIGVVALTRGISALFFAYRLHELRRAQ